MIFTIENPINFSLPKDWWYFVYNNQNKKIIVDIHYIDNDNSVIYSPFTLKISDFKSELSEYIKNNNLIELYNFL